MRDREQERRDKAREAMAQAGVPEDVIDYALAQGPSRFAYYGMQIAFSVLLLTGLVGALLVFHQLDRLADTTARGAALAANAPLFTTTFGISLAIGGFAWVFASACAVDVMTSLTPRERASVFVFSFLNPKEVVYARAAVKKLNANRPENPDDYIRRVKGGWTKAFAWIAALLFAMTAVVIEREMKTHTLYTPQAMIASPLLPWETTKVLPWSDAAAIETGCNHVTGRNSSDDLIYEVVFRNGRSERLEDAKPVKGSWLDEIEILDAAIAARGVPHRRWRFRDRDPLHPECLRANEARYGADWPRVLKLLRVDPPSADNASTE